MLIDDLDNYYLKHQEPIQGCLLALRDIILKTNKDIISLRKYRIPFFYYKNNRLAFLWVYRKKIVVGFIIDKHIYTVVPGIKRKDEIETILLDPNTDIPIDFILEKLQYRLQLYDKSAWEESPI